MGSPYRSSISSWYSVTWAPSSHIIPNSSARGSHQQSVACMQLLAMNMFGTLRQRRLPSNFFVSVRFRPAMHESSRQIPYADQPD
jgi:hypothetical protein